MRNRLGLLYGILVALLLAIGVWWVVFLSNEGRLAESYRLQRFEFDELHARLLIQADPRIAEDPDSVLRTSFPHLVFTRGAGGWEVDVDPSVVEEVRGDARRKRNMILAEGLVFLVLLGGGAAILVLSVRSESRFRQARELFLAGATHELKTPLASLRLAAETLGREDVRQEDRARLRASLVEDAGRLESLVDGLLAMSAETHLAGGRRENLDLVPTCRQVIDELERYRSERGAVFELKASGAACILGNRVTFGLALSNLLVNAVHHCPPPVRVEVEITPGDRWHRVAVKDDGPGIPRRLHKKVFDCFFSDDCGRGGASGAGLGLYLVRRNTELLGGRVELASEPGAGSTFTMILPTADAG